MQILISGMTGNCGGIEVYLLNLAKYSDKNMVQLSFLQERETIAFEEELKKVPCEIIKIAWRRSHPLKHMKELVRLLEEHPEYKIVYINGMSSVCLPTAIAAKRAGRIVLLHSRNNKTKHMMIHYLLRPVLNHYCDERFACSELAGKYMFGTKPFHVIPNGINFETFHFDADIRQKMRQELRIEEDEFVIGFIGNYTYQKNVLYLLDIFRAYHKQHEKSKLVMLGDGELKKKMEEKIDSYHLRNSVMMVGQKNNPQDYYQAFDVFLFPSRYEGFGNVLLEAQLSGLPCICSKYVIPESTRISEKITYVPLQANLQEWCNAIESYKSSKREVFIGNGEEKKHELHYAVAHVQKMLCKCYENNSL